MPTLRPRFQVTETPEVERALAAAARAWPDATRSELVTRLFTLGADSLESERSAQRAERGRAVDLTSGAFEVEYDEGYLESIREGWPE